MSNAVLDFLMGVAVGVCVALAFLVPIFERQAFEAGKVVGRAIERKRLEEQL